LQYISPDGEENYPGTLTVNVLFELKERELWIGYRAKTDKKCFVNLTHHPYFNLNQRHGDIKNHQLKLYTDKYLKTDDLIPDGEFVKMKGVYDFSEFKALNEVIEKNGGLDDCFVFDSSRGIQRQAELFCSESGIKLYVCSDYPGLQVYTGRYLNVSNAKNGDNYGPYAGVALEAQYWPDSPNHPAFPSTLLLPEQEYVKTTIYGFE
jgi:aldose 1-epimerase